MGQLVRRAWYIVTGRRQELAVTLVDLSRQGRTVLVATHDEEFVRSCATRIVMLDATKITAGPDS